MSWIECASTPDRLISNPVLVNQHEIIIVVETNINPMLVVAQDTIYNNAEIVKGFYKYNIIKNEWELFSAFPDGSSFINCKIVFNAQTSELYIQATTMQIKVCGIIQIIDFNTMKYMQPHMLNENPDVPSCLLLNDECHIIGGQNSNKHKKWNPKETKVETIHEFKEWKVGNVCHGLIHIKSKKQLLLFGGYDDGITEDSKKDLGDIWTYCIKHNEWKLLETKMPIKSNSFGYILTNDERYVIIFGGESEDKNIDDIFVLDLKYFKFKHVDLKCPVSGGLHAVYTENMIYDIKLVSGFIRSYNFACPNDILRIIMLFYVVNDVFLLHHYDGTGFWKIAIDDIIPNYTFQCIQKYLET
eukprot:46849_1